MSCRFLRELDVKGNRAFFVQAAEAVTERCGLPKARRVDGRREELARETWKRLDTAARRWLSAALN
jgi:hypothetical protein